MDDETVAALTSAGFEVGVHGLYHDGRDLESERMLRKRLPEIRRYAERWRAVGFRSPATNRDWSLMPLLGFDYDSSFPDTDPFEPQAGGCCSLLPYFNGDLVELPITLPIQISRGSLPRGTKASPDVTPPLALRDVDREGRELHP